MARASSTKKNRTQPTGRVRQVARDYIEARAVYADRFAEKKDWAAEIANAIIISNLDDIYRGFSKTVSKDVKVFQALSSRAYGMPSQEVTIDQEKPFKLVVEYIGAPEKKTETIDAEVIEETRQLGEGEGDGE